MPKLNEQSLKINKLKLAIYQAMKNNVYTEIECLKALTEIQFDLISNMASDERKSA